MLSRIYSYLIVFLLAVQVSHAQEVPAHLTFGNIELTINDAARRQIQEDVDALTRSPTYFNAKVDQARLYFPIIERIFEEENVPLDFKYLVIQESAFIADAVSVSDAVGYWQFKDFTAVEMGLRVDKQIDERMNIVSSTRAAARYIKKNNFYFNNWIYALQAYQMGAGGVQKAEDDKYFGERKMTITKKTYWYVKKYLAHRIAYGHALEREETIDKELVEYTRGANKDFRDLSAELMIEASELAAYNKWLKKGAIPSDKTYTVIVPVESGSRNAMMFASAEPQKLEVEPETELTYEGIEDPSLFPQISAGGGLFNRSTEEIKVNGIPGFVYSTEFPLEEKLQEAGISDIEFRKYNELLPHVSLQEGQVYYLKKKKGKAKAHYHTLQENETIWEVSQRYGLKTSKLLKKNRLKDANEVRPGMVLWLRYIRPASEPIQYKPLEVPEELAEEVAEVPEEVAVISVPEVVDSIEDSISTKELIHIVEAKENYYRIAKLYDVEVMDLVAYNDLNLSDGLQVGQILKVQVPLDFVMEENTTQRSESPEESNEEPVMYTVQVGDTLYSISSRFGLTTDELMKLNGRNNSHLSVGEQLIVK